MFIYVLKELCSTLFRSGAESDEYSDFPGLQFHGELYIVVSVWVQTFFVVLIRFPGTVSYNMTQQLWIDNDIVFNTEKFYATV